MISSKRFKPILRIAESREQEAARILGQAQQQLSAIQHQLNELHQYRQDYRQKMHSSINTGLGAQNLNNYHRFLGQLDTAIEQLNGQMAQAKQQVDLCRQGWMKRHGRSRVLDKVREKAVLMERKIQDKREQSILDDRAPRGFSAED